MKRLAGRGMLATGTFSFALALMTSVSGTSTTYACSSGVSIQGTAGHYFVGGDQVPTSAFPDEVRTDMTVYNPYPVYTFSGIWVALEKSSGEFAQAGYTHRPGDTSEYVFVQYKDNAGQVSPLYKENVPGFQPEYFEVDYLYSNGGFQFCWSEACVTYNSQSCQLEGGGSCAGLTWVPDQLANYGETQDYTYQSGGNSWGSHAVGDFNHLVFSNPVEWFHAGSGNYANLNYVSSSIADYQSLGHSSGYTWDTFDSRC